MIYSLGQRVGDRLDYGFVLSQWLIDGDTVASSTWAATPAGLTLDDAAINATPIVRFGESHAANTCTSIYVAGGVVGTEYAITNTVTSVQGRIGWFTLRFRVRA